MTTVPQRLPREELINTITHGAGLLASIIGAVVLVGMTMGSRNPLEVPSVVIYCATLILVYLSSTLYHAVLHPETKSRLQVFDHCAIYLLIAGTYTPLLLLGVGGQLGWTLFALIWAMAACGVVFKWFFTGRMGTVSMMTYIGMGWIAVFAAQPLLSALPSDTVVLIVAGGLSYTLGSVVFLSTRPYAHTVWHLFVLVGSTCHFFAMVARVPIA
ncbi:MAG: hemolysin III family protein [Candidatus Binatia bacterium]